MSKVSVIIPVYNSEAYLNTLAKCLKNQTYSDLEIIFINDGSTDKSLSILKQIKDNDQRVKIYTQNNSGVSSARNKGIEYACGKYIAFIDADDTIKDDYFEVLVNLIEALKADIVCSGIEQILLDKDNKYVNKETISYDDKIVESFDSYLKDGTYFFVVCSKLFRTELIKNIRFEPIRYGEDSRFMAKVFSLKPRTCLTKYVGYNYYRWQQSATKNSKIYQKDLEANQSWLDIIEDYLYPNASFGGMDWILKKYMSYSSSVIIKLVKYKNKKRFYDFRKTKFYNKISKLPYDASYSTKLIHFLYKYCPGLLWVILRIILKLRSR